MSSKWTEAQQQVITHNAGNLLVSASAGSGKTSVLIEKIVSLITSKSCHLKNLLVVTFTNAANLEIRQRLTIALQQSGNLELLNELDDLSVSDILTFDSFCIKIVKEFGYEIGQNNNFSVADTSLSGFLQNQALDNIIGKHNKNLDTNFVSLLDTFFDGRNENTFRKGVISIYNFLKSKTQSTSYKQKLNELFDLSNKDNEAIKFLNDYLIATKNNFYAEVEKLHTQSLIYDDEKLSEALNEILTNLEYLDNENFFTNLHTLKVGLDLKLPAKSKKDIFEITEIKDSFAEQRKIFYKNLEYIVSKEILELDMQDLQKDLTTTKERLTYLFDFVEEFDQEYTKLKDNMQVLDFVDIENLANKILNNNAIKTALQNRYNWIFIDEYQDTSLLQEDIVQKVTSGNNLFMVGDFKQSIYRFRQAEPKIFINKYNQYKSMQSAGSVIELKTNFRSENSILQFNNFVFDKIYKESIDEFEYKGNADLEFGGKCKAEDNAHVKIFLLNKTKEDEQNAEENITNHEIENLNNLDKKDNLKVNNVYSVKNSTLVQDNVDNISKEAVIIADEIKEMLKKTYYDAKSNTFKPITFSDIAVLSRGKNSVLPKIRKIFNQANIPVTTVYDDNLFENYDMQMLLSILKTIQNLKNDESLISTLISIGGVTLDELATIRQKYTSDFYYNAMLVYKEQNDDVISKKINAFLQKIKYYKNQSNYLDICELILLIVEKENLGTYFAVNNYGEEFESHLNLLLDNIQSIKNNSLFSFLNFIDTYGTNLCFENTIKDAENSVTLCTIHKSKGLEYPVVFLVGAGKNFSTISEAQKILFDNDWGISMPSFDLDRHVKYDNLIQKAFKLKIKSENKKEEKRLLYVALTRPKNYLTIVGSEKFSNLKSLNTDFKIYGSTSYMQWLMGCFDDEELQSLQTNKKQSKILKNNQNGIELFSRLETTLVNENEFDFDIVPLEKPDFEQLQVDKDEFINILTKRFEHNSIAKKNTVTQIMAEDEHYNISNFNYQKSDKQNDTDFLTIGTAYHKYMELIDFVEDENAIKEQIKELKLQNKILPEYCALVDENKIILAVKQLADLINNDKVLKEQQFLAYMPANNFVKTDKTNKILVQGVADLIIVREHDILLVDYKTSRLKEQEFAEKYETQLNIYSKAIQCFYNKQVAQKAIYSFYLNKLIII